MREFVENAKINPKLKLGYVDNMLIDQIIVLIVDQFLPKDAIKKAIDGSTVSEKLSSNGKPRGVVFNR